MLIALMTVAGCSTPGGIGVTPQAASSDYFVTKGAGFALHLDGQRAIDSCRYSILLAPRKSIEHPLYLRTRFENPSDPSQPLITDTDVQPGSGDIHISSSEVRGLQSHVNYKVEVLIFDSAERTHQVGQHVQYVRYTQPSFAK